MNLFSNKKVIILAVSLIIATLAVIYFFTSGDSKTIEDQFASEYASCEDQAENYKNKPEGTVIQNIQQHNTDYRIVARDGESFPVTMDLRPDRINLTISGDTVTNASCG